MSILKVKCINGDYSNVSDKIKPILIVGDPMPEKGEIYEVEEEIHWNTKELPNYMGYVLRGFDYSAYGFKVGFNSQRFEVVEGDGFETVFDKRFNDIVEIKEITLIMDFKNV